MPFDSHRLLDMAYMEQIQEDALSVVYERLPHITPSWRYTLSDPLLEIFDFCVDCVRSSASPLLSALGVLQTLVDTAITEELNFLTELAPILLEALPKWASEDDVMESGLALLESVM
jgi:hypothetical protein